MKIKYLLQFIFVVCLCSCSDSSNDRTSKKGQKQFGLDIVNGPRQGYQYIDSAKTEYNYRYNTFTLTNDTIIPIRLEIGFSNKSLSDSSNSQIFLLPRRLTPEYQHMDPVMSRELKQFLDFEIDLSEHLNKIINPNEKCVLTFGVLTDTKYLDPTTPYETKLLTSNESSAQITLRLKINDTLIIPCGHFSYVDK